MRIGLVADTHELRDPSMLLDRLSESSCPLNVHLGDIAGSWLVTQLARRFKRDDGPYSLSASAMESFNRYLAEGLPPVSAFIEASIGDDVELRQRRRDDIQKGYDSVVQAMSRLRRPLFIAGNVDRVLLSVGSNKTVFERHHATLVTRPTVWKEEGLALLAWPSMKRESTEAGALDGRLEQETRHLASESGRLVVLAHEQLFRGPVPSSYRSNVARRGFRATTIPHYEPNRLGAELLRIIRSLPDTVEVSIVSGHIHDSQDVIQAGAPYLKGSAEQGMSVRIWGLGGLVGARKCRRDGRRTLKHFHVPAGRPCILITGAGEGPTSMELLPPVPLSLMQG